MDESVEVVKMLFQERRSVLIVEIIVRVQLTEEMVEAFVVSVAGISERTFNSCRPV